MNHFVNPAPYVGIMPPYLPWHVELVYLSGFFEFIFGIGILVPKFSSLAAWGLVALLVAIFPANLHMAMNAELYPDIPKIALLLRLPLQFALIYWAYRYTKRSRK